MNCTIGCIPLVIAVFSWSIFAFSQEAITEDDVVNVLSGEQQHVAPQRPPGIAFNVAFDPYSPVAYSVESKRPGGKELTDQDFYDKLLLVGRAVESQALQRFRFAIMVHSDLPRSESHDSTGSLQVAETIKYFLTANFAIQPDRLLISKPSARQRGDDQFSISGPPLESSGIPNWRVEILRFE